MRMLELFSGTGNMAAAFKRQGWKTLTVDNTHQADENTLISDVRDLDRETIIDALGGEPRVIWASPPCTAFSVAAISRNWQQDEDGVPRPISENAYHGIAVLRRTLEIIKMFPLATFFIENPRCMMRTLPEMKDLYRRETITFCQYGEHRQKPTDIWTNSKQWIPRPPCKSGSPCHDAQPRGYKQKLAIGAIGKGTQGIKGAKARGALPPQLCEEIATTMTAKYKER